MGRQISSASPVEGVGEAHFLHHLLLRLRELRSESKRVSVGHLSAAYLQTILDARTPSLFSPLPSSPCYWILFSCESTRLVLSGRGGASWGFDPNHGVQKDRCLERGGKNAVNLTLPDIDSISRCGCLWMQCSTAAKPSRRVITSTPGGMGNGHSG